MKNKTVAEAAEANFEKPFELPEIILMLFIVGGADFYEVAAGFLIAVPVIGQVLIFFGFLVDLFVFLIIQFWFIMKGASRHAFIIKRSLVYLVGSLAEFMPGLDILPIRTAALLISVYLANHPKLEEKIKLLEKL